ncbi:MAG: hypothetical protein RI897_2480 [Verrucomicrobiota bacterium]
MDLDVIAIGIEGGHGFAVDGGGSVFGDEVHEAGDADVCFGGGSEQGDDDLLLDCGMDASAHFFLGEAALFEEFLQE